MESFINFIKDNIHKINQSDLKNLYDRTGPIYDILKKLIFDIDKDLIFNINPNFIFIDDHILNTSCNIILDNHELDNSIKCFIRSDFIISHPNNFELINDIYEELYKIDVSSMQTDICFTKYVPYSNKVYKNYLYSFYKKYEIKKYDYVQKEDKFKFIFYMDENKISKNNDELIIDISNIFNYLDEYMATHNVECILVNTSMSECDYEKLKDLDFLYDELIKKLNFKICVLCKLHEHNIDLFNYENKYYCRYCRSIFNKLKTNFIKNIN